jgi:hypothetical protein
MDDKYKEKESFIASRRMFDAAKVTYEQIKKIEVEIHETNNR